jgi:hypothetical protein
VVAVGETEGFCAVDVNPAGLDDHEYVYPVPPVAAALSVVADPVQTEAGVALAVTDKVLA